MRARLFAAILVVLAAAGAAGADAGEAAARAHFARGTAHYDQARYREALGEFEAALRLSGRPLLYYNIGVCQERLGNLEAARDAFARYLDGAPAAPDRASVESRIRLIDQALARAAAARPAAAATEKPVAEARAQPSPAPRRWPWVVAAVAIVAVAAAAVVVGFALAQPAGFAGPTLPPVTLR